MPSQCQYKCASPFSLSVKSSWKGILSGGWLANFRPQLESGGCNIQFSRDLEKALSVCLEMFCVNSPNALGNKFKCFYSCIWLSNFKSSVTLRRCYSKPPFKEPLLWWPLLLGIWHFLESTRFNIIEQDSDLLWLQSVLVTWQIVVLVGNLQLSFPHWKSSIAVLWKTLQVW